MEQKMFCYQCQETAGCKGCTMSGICGKKPDVAAMQDLLVYVTKGISAITTALRQEGKQVSAKINHLITLNLFTTITNANFDKESIESRIRATLTEKEVLLKQVTNLTVLPEAAKWNGSENWEEKARTVGVLSTENEDIRSLRELITYGLKGLSAYSKHANVLLKDNDEVDAFLQKALAATLNDNLSVEDLIALTMETGKYGVSGMAMLDKANTDSYGNPEITKVNIGVRKNPGILVSGHDLRDLEMLLEQTQGTGVDVYTHSEMLPAHYYPKFKHYKHFAGNYGNAWWKQNEEFEKFKELLVNSISAYHYLEKIEEAKIKINTEVHENTLFVHILRDMSTVSQNEIKLINTLMNEHFGAAIIRDSIGNTEQDNDGLQEELIDHMLGNIKINHVSEHIIGLWEEGCVLVFNK